MLIELKSVLKEMNSEKSNKVVWEVSTIEYIGGKRNADSALFDTFSDSNNFYNKVTSCFERKNKFEILKSTTKEENNLVVFRNVVYKVLETEKYKTFGVCLKRKNVYETNQIVGNII